MAERSRRNTAEVRALLTRAELTEICLHAFESVLGRPDTAPEWPKGLTNKRLRRGTFGRGVALTAITSGAVYRSGNPRSAVSRATAAGIATTIRRGREALRQIKTQTDH